MRGWAPLLVTLTTAAAGVASDQRVFQNHAAPGLEPAQRVFDKGNSTGNLIFRSVSSLLQVWPNTRYINGMVTFR